jgi:hypothetical protein
MTLEELFKEAGKEWDELYWQRFLEKINSVPDYYITIETDKKIIEYIKKLEIKYLYYYYNNKRNRFRNSKKRLKVLLVAAVLIIILSVSAFSFNPVKDFFFKVYEKGTEFFFNYDKNATDDYLYAEYTFIPKGYHLVQKRNFKLGQQFVYKKEDKRIVIDTNITKHSSSFIDTENANVGEIVVGKYNGYYSITDSEIIVIWSTGKYCHSITSDFNEELINLDLVVKIAESRIPEN